MCIWKNIQTEEQQVKGSKAGTLKEGVFENLGQSKQALWGDGKSQDQTPSG